MTTKTTAVSAREVPPEIQWHEGMLLAPQHFQLMSQRQEALLHFRAAALMPFGWGVRRIEIDRSALTEGIFRLLSLEAVMPDGLVVTHPSPGNSDLSVALDPAALRDPAKVYLAVTTRGIALAERYDTSQSVKAADETSAGSDPVEIPVLHPKLQLVIGEEQPLKYVRFPVAQVAHRHEGFVTTRFEPPWLRVLPGTPIFDLCLGIASKLRDKAGFLAEQVRSPSSSATAPQLLETKLLVHALVGELPAFEALLRSGAAHPFTLYVSLCSVLGHVAGLSRALVPPLLRPYDQNDPMAAFTEIQTAITRTINEGVQESYTQYVFTIEGDEYRIGFDSEWSGRPLLLGVRAPSGVSDQEMAGWVASSVISGRSKLVPMRDRRVTGAPRKQVEAESDLVPPRGVTLFSFAPDPDYVNPGEELVIVNPGSDRLRPESIVLYVKNRV